MLTCPACRGLTPVGASPSCLHCDAPLRQPPRWALRLTKLLGPAGALILAACYGAPPGYYHAQRPISPTGATRIDHDGDGDPGPYECPAPASTACLDEIGHLNPPPDMDCDDGDRTRYHGAPDPAGDGIDQDCDGVDGPHGAPAAAPTTGGPYAEPPPNRTNTRAE